MTAFQPNAFQPNAFQIGVIQSTTTTVTPRGRRSRRYKTQIPLEPEKQERALGALSTVTDLELPARDETVYQYSTLTRDAAEYAATETRKILDYMEREEAEKIAKRRRKAAYLLLLN